ncbi:MAG: hypothetical protein LLG06_02175 [Desulfobacteraceae bacterium]|nr:hypothetical protein [Desulfobacteraceae bacterium]
MYVDILLYCDLYTLKEHQDAVYEGEGAERKIVTPEVEDETWKHPSGKILQFGLSDEIVRDYVLLAEIDGKVAAYCNVEEEQAIRIIQHIEGNPSLGYKSWSCYDSLLLDTDNAAIAEQIFLYQIEREIEIMGKTATAQVFVSVAEAQEDGVTIVQDSITVPNQWA